MSNYDREPIDTGAEWGCAIFILAVVAICMILNFF